MGKLKEILSKTSIQIKELAKFPRGVAAIYQNDWIDSVLCQIEQFPSVGSDGGFAFTTTTGPSYTRSFVGIRPVIRVRYEKVAN